MRADKDFVGTHAGKRNFAGLHGATSQKLSNLLHCELDTREFADERRLKKGYSQSAD